MSGITRLAVLLTVAALSLIASNRINACDEYIQSTVPAEYTTVERRTDLDPILHEYRVRPDYSENYIDRYYSDRYDVVPRREYRVYRVEPYASATVVTRDIPSRGE